MIKIFFRLKRDVRIKKPELYPLSVVSGEKEFV